MFLFPISVKSFRSLKRARYQNILSFCFHESQPGKFFVRKAFYSMKNKLSTNELWRFLMVAVGTVIFSAAINLFLTPLKLYNGGALGISQLARTILVDRLHLLNAPNIDISGIIYFLLNVPLFLLAYKGVSRLFFLKTAMSVALTTFIVTVIPVPNPLIIEEPLTSCIIGGLMYGVGVGLCLYAGGSGGGTDILGIYFSKNYRNFSVGKVNIIINGVIYLVCALMFDLQTAIYLCGTLLLCGGSRTLTKYYDPGDDLYQKNWCGRSNYERDLSRCDRVEGRWCLYTRINQYPSYCGFQI